MKKLYFKNQLSEQIVGILEENKNSDVVIIIAHGFNASKDHGFLPKLASKLRKRFNVFRFDFSGNGESQGKFEDQCLKNQIGELKTAVEFMRKRFKRVFVAGHSLGACIALAEYCKYKDVEGLIFIAPAFVLSKRLLISLFGRTLKSLIFGKVCFKNHERKCLKRKFFLERLIFKFKMKSLLKIANRVSFAILAESDRLINNEKCIKIFKKTKINYATIKNSGHGFKSDIALRELATNIERFLVNFINK